MQVLYHITTKTGLEIQSTSLSAAFLKVNLLSFYYNHMSQPHSALITPHSLSNRVQLTPREASSIWQMQKFLLERAYSNNTALPPFLSVNSLPNFSVISHQSWAHTTQIYSYTHKLQLSLWQIKLTHLKPNFKCYSLEQKGSSRREKGNTCIFSGDFLAWSLTLTLWPRELYTDVCTH